MTTEVLTQIRDNVEPSCLPTALRSISNFTEKVPRRIALGVVCLIGNRLLKSKLFSNGSGDSSFGLNSKEKFSLLSLPRKIRDRILSYLSPNELLKLRRVCCQLQRDIDYHFGLHAIIDSNFTESFEWVQSIVLQGCYVKFLDDPLNYSFIAKPSALRRISFGKSFPIDPAILFTVLSKFHALRELNFCIGDSGEEDGDGFSCEMITELLKLFVENLVDSIHVEFLQATWKLLWKLRFPKDRYKDHIFSELDEQIVPKVENVYLNFPMISKNHRSLWLTFLCNLNNLRSLYLNLGDIFWELSAPIIEGNSRTLTRISLSHVRTTTVDNQSRFKENPFDWKIFEDCDKLRFLDVSCNLRLIPNLGIGLGSPIITSVNLDKLPARNLEYLLLSYVSFTEEQFQLMMKPNWAPKLVKGCLFHCGIDGKPTDIPILYLSEPMVDTSDAKYYPEICSGNPYLNAFTRISSTLGVLRNMEFFIAILMTGYVIVC